MMLLVQVNTTFFLFRQSGRTVLPLFGLCLAFVLMEDPHHRGDVIL